MQLSADEAQWISGRMCKNRDAIFSKYQPSIFSKRSATRFPRRSIALRNHDRFGGSAIAQHGICPQRILPSDRSFLISRDTRAKNKRRNDCAASRICAESFADGRTAQRRCGEKTQAPHHDHRWVRARVDPSHNCNFAFETSCAERR